MVVSWESNVALTTVLLQKKCYIIYIYIYIYKFIVSIALSVFFFFLWVCLLWNINYLAQWSMNCWT